MFAEGCWVAIFDMSAGIHERGVRIYDTIRRTFAYRRHTLSVTSAHRGRSARSLKAAKATSTTSRFPPACPSRTALTSASTSPFRALRPSPEIPSPQSSRSRRFAHLTSLSSPSPEPPTSPNPMQSFTMPPAIAGSIPGGSTKLLNLLNFLIVHKSQRRAIGSLVSANHACTTTVVLKRHHVQHVILAQVPTAPNTFKRNHVSTRAPAAELLSPCGGRSGG